MKKVISWMMAAIFVASMVQVNVHAEEIVTNEFADKLSEVGMFNGSDKGFELDREPTRLEGLVMMMRMLGIEEEAQNYDEKVVNFKDVPAWGERYVQYAYKLNITKGVSSEQFGSAQQMDKKSYLTLMLRSLGYDDDNNDFTWANAAEKAVEVGIIKKSEMNSTKFTRGDVAEVSYNTLKVNLKGQEKLLVEKLVEDNKIDRTKVEKLDIEVRGQEELVDEEELSLYKENMLAKVKQDQPAGGSISSGSKMPGSGGGGGGSSMPGGGKPEKKPDKEPVVEEPVVEEPVVEEPVVEEPVVEEPVVEEPVVEEPVVEEPVVEEPVVEEPVVEEPVVEEPVVEEPVVEEPVVEEPVVEEPVVEEPVVEEPVLINSLDVNAFGAVGDGVTDDTTAIQNAINEASASNKVLVFEENKTYRVNRTLLIKSNLHISGYGATLYMPSQSGLVNMMLTDYGKYVTNVTVEGLTFKSKNDRAGTGYATDSLTSNVTAMHFTGINNLNVQDVNMYDMNVGIKFGVSSVNQINEDITLDNTHIYRSLTPILMNTTNGFTMTNGTLDASAGSSRYLHSVYIDKNTSNITFDNVLFENSPGAGVHLYNGYANTSASTNINILNSRVQDSRVGILIFSGANNVTVSNVDIVRVDLGFSIDNVSNVDINNVNIMEPTAITDVPKSAFRIKNMYQSSIKNVTIDGNGMEGILFNIYQNLIDVIMSNITATNINDLHLFYADSSSNVENLVVSNSTFEMNKVTTQRARFLGTGSTALFDNNTFVNTGAKYSSLFNNSTSTSVSLNGNKYSGFTNLANTSDGSILSDNINLD